MAEPFLGEIMIFGGNFAPYNWAFCNGQLLSVSTYTALFSLLGTTYGGNGQTTFALPNLQGRVPVHFGSLAGGSNYVLGEMGGTENVTLTQSQMPMHTHIFNPAGSTVSVQAGDGAGTSSSPGGNYITNASGSTTGGDSFTATNYAPQSGAGNLANIAGVSLNFGGNAIGIAGGSQPFSVLQPFLALNFVISLYGVYPTRN